MPPHEEGIHSTRENTDTQTDQSDVWPIRNERDAENHQARAEHGDGGQNDKCEECGSTHGNVA